MTTPGHGRLLVGLLGRQLDLPLMRYAAMVLQAKAPVLADDEPWPTPRRAARDRARLAEGVRARTSPAASAVAPANGDAEVRFVAVPPRARREVNRRRARAEHAALRSQVDFFQARVAGPIAVSCDVLEGGRVERLSSLAAEFDSDVLLVGENGSPRREQVRLAMTAPCPVWLAPPGWAPVLRRILVPIDFSIGSAQCLQTAVDLARRFPPAKCLALHVDRLDVRCSGEEIERARREALLNRYRAFARGIGAEGVQVEPLVVKGRSVEGAISRAADRHAVDLVVMCTRGRSRVTGKLLPSVTEAAVRSCPGAMLVLKSPDGALNLREALRERWRRGDDVQFS